MPNSNQYFWDYIYTLKADEEIPRWTGYLPEKQMGVHGSFFDLHPVMRALLIADGTVTTAIEAIYKEPVRVKVLQQEMTRAEADIPLLGTLSGDETFYREVCLIGSKTDKEYVKAYSLLREDAFSADLWAKLQNQELGMGVVLRNAAESSFRQVVHIGAGDLGTDDPNQNHRTHIHRTYSVHIGGQVAILITEVFNMEAFKSGYK